MTVWGYVLEGDGRPDPALQVRVACLHGASAATIWRDHLPARPTHPRSVLQQRGMLVGALKEGDRVLVATPLCLGLSGDDLRWFVYAAHDAGASVMVHELAAVYRPGDDLSDLVAIFERARNALYARRARRKAKQEAE